MKRKPRKGRTRVDRGETTTVHDRIGGGWDAFTYLHVVEVEEGAAHGLLESGDHVRRVLHGHLLRRFFAPSNENRSSSVCYLGCVNRLINCVFLNVLWLLF